MFKVSNISNIKILKVIELYMKYKYDTSLHVREKIMFI